MKGKELELFERLSSIQHEIWTSWMKYMMWKKCPLSYGDRGKLLGRRIMEEDVRHWERQMVTAYNDLTEEEKEGDREQVRKFWQLIKPLLDNS